MYMHCLFELSLFLWTIAMFWSTPVYDEIYSILILDKAKAFSVNWSVMIEQLEFDTLIKSSRKYCKECLPAIPEFFDAYFSSGKTSLGRTHCYWDWQVPGHRGAPLNIALPTSLRYLKHTEIRESKTNYKPSVGDGITNVFIFFFKVSELTTNKKKANELINNIFLKRERESKYKTLYLRLNQSRRQTRRRWGRSKRYKVEMIQKRRP